MLPAHLIYRGEATPLRHALFAIGPARITHKDVPLPVIIDRQRQERENEKGSETGVPLYAPTPEPPPPAERKRDRQADEPKRGVIIIGGDDDPTKVDFTI